MLSQRLTYYYYSLRTTYKRRLSSDNKFSINSVWSFVRVSLQRGARTSRRTPVYSIIYWMRCREFKKTSTISVVVSSTIVYSKIDFKSIKIETKNRSVGVLDSKEEGIILVLYTVYIKLDSVT
jgi:hypothetical protein